MVPPPPAGAIMPRQVILSALEREALLVLPANRDAQIRWYTFSELDLALVRQRRGDANRLGFAVHLCLLRYLGQGLTMNALPDEMVLEWIGQTFRIDPSCWPQYATCEETRREHLLKLRGYLDLASVTAKLGISPHGLSILEGPLGTGKTSYLRHLMGVLKETHRFYFIPPATISVLSLT